MPRKISTSGMIALGSFFPFFPGISLSTSISFKANFPNVACSLSREMRRDFADELVDGYVSVITWARMSGVRRLRIEEMDRRARSEYLASNRVTARSSNGKLLLISAVKSVLLVFAM